LQCENTVGSAEPKIIEIQARLLVLAGGANPVSSERIIAETFVLTRSEEEHGGTVLLSEGETRKS
jgi:hypothetical protein